MCQKRTIEELEQVLCVLKEKFQREINVEPVLLNGDDLVALQQSDNVWYYGILTVGADTTHVLTLFGGAVMPIAAESQIIELFNFTAIAHEFGNNSVFRGWQLNISGTVPDLTGGVFAPREI